MHCLYCGKDIGALRLLKDREFCSAAHRKSYKDRLGKVLTQIAADNMPPPPQAGFKTHLSPHTGNLSSIIAPWRTGGWFPPAQIPGGWPDALRATAEAEPTPIIDQMPARSAGWMVSPRPELAERWLSPSMVSACPVALAPVWPEMPVLRTEEPMRRPPVCVTYAAVPATEPVSTWLQSAAVTQVAVMPEVVLPTYPILAIDAAAEQLIACDVYAALPAAEPAAAWLQASAAEASPVAPGMVLPALPDLAIAAAAELPLGQVSTSDFAVEPSATEFRPSVREAIAPTLYSARPPLSGLAIHTAMEQSVGRVSGLDPTADSTAVPSHAAAGNPVPPVLSVAIPALSGLGIDVAAKPGAALDAHAALPAVESNEASLRPSVADELPASPAITHPAPVNLTTDAAAEPPAGEACARDLAAEPGTTRTATADSIAASGSIALPAPSGLGIDAVLDASALCESLFTLAAPEPAASWIQASTAAPSATPVPIELPAPPSFAIDSTLTARFAADTPLGVCESWAAAPVPEAVANFLRPSLSPARSEPIPVIAPAFDLVSAIDGAFTRQFDADTPLGVCESWAEASAPEPVADILRPSSSPEQSELVRMAAPAFGIVAAKRAAPATCRSFPPASPEPVAAFLNASTALEWQNPIQPAFHLPFGITAGPDPLPFYETPGLCEEWHLSPPAEPVWRFLASAVSGTIPISTSQAAPVLRLPATGPYVPQSSHTRPVPRPEPVMAGVWPRIADTPLHNIGQSIPLCLPEIFGRIAAHGTPAPARRIAHHVPAPELPRHTSSSEPVTATPILRMQPFALGQSGGHSALDRPRIASKAAEPAVASGVAILEPIATLRVTAPEHWSARTSPAIPRPSYIAIEYHMQRTRNGAFSRPEWKTARFEPVGPRFSIRAALEKLEDPVKSQNAQPTPIFRNPEPRRARSAMALHAGRIAAAILVVAAVWFSAAAVKSRGRLSLRPDDTSYTASNRVLTADSRTGDPNPPASAGPLGWVRRSLGNRATLQVGEDFQHGMQSWGVTADSYAQGWQHHRDGYVRIGALALFKPTKTFTDYRLEFFGQIESKSMGWAVRARDEKNYHAMKFTVLAGGLRPIIALVHYNVIDGKAARAVQTPLNVMVHNNQPVQVAVNVRGNRMVTSVDGEEVDTYINDVLPSGGVGFFSDAGEQARLYWAKVTKNDDWLGHICAFLAGDDGRATAELRAPAAGGGEAPEPPVDPPSAIAAAGMGLPYFRRNYTRRHTRCNS